MKLLSYQKGIGLVEVVVAILLLAVAVLGFSALQVNAINATDESVARSRAMTLSKQISENIRLNTSNASDYVKAFNDLNEGTDNISEYCSDVKSKVATISTNSCISKSCTATEVAEINTWKAANLACEKDIMLNMTPCPEMTGINARQCVIASWGSTLPVMDKSESKACSNEDGTYKLMADCLIMEAY